MVTPTRLARQVMLWLVLITIPLHGFGTAMAYACTGMPVASSVVTGQHADAAKAYPPSATTCPMSAMGCVSTPSKQASSHVSAPKCGFMAACAGVVTAPPSTPPLLVLSAGAAALPPLPVLPRVGFFTDAPERPPRLLA